MKKEYIAPAVADLGSVRELTLGQADGDFTDAEFPDGTPKSDLTFS